MTNEYSVFPEPLNEAVDQVAKTRLGDQPPSTTDALRLARLKVLGEIERDVKAAQRAVVDQLRENPDVNTWAVIGDQLSITENAAWQRYGATESSTPESRAVRPAAAKKVQLEGATITEAATQAKTSRAIVLGRIKREPDAPWLSTTYLPGREKPTYRITDMELFLAGRAGPGRPKKLKSDGDEKK